MSDVNRSTEPVYMLSNQELAQAIASTWEMLSKTPESNSERPKLQAHLGLMLEQQYVRARKVLMS